MCKSRVRLSPRSQGLRHLSHRHNLRQTRPRDACCSEIAVETGRDRLRSSTTWREDLLPTVHLAIKLPNIQSEVYISLFPQTNISGDDIGHDPVSILPQTRIQKCPKGMATSVAVACSITTFDGRVLRNYAGVGASKS